MTPKGVYKNMKKYLDVFMDMQDTNFLKFHTQALMTRELPQTSAANHEAADYIYQLALKCGLDVQRLDFVSDGKTVCQDKIMPICWDASYGRLTVMSEWEGERIIADYDKEPFSLVRYSTSTPEGGLTARLVTWEQMQSGVDVKGAFVSIPQGTLPTDKVLVPILNAGAVGLVNGTVREADRTPDNILWANNCTETNSWHVNADERPFIAFCVTPRILEKLEKATLHGQVLLKAETDGHRFEGRMPAVTALLKGESKREFWVLAHTAEPLENDNSSGVISCIYSMYSIKRALESGKIPPLKYSIRVLFSTELYGFAAFAEYFGGVLKTRCIGALCVDCMPICPGHDQVKLKFAPSAVPFYGNCIFEGIWDAYRVTVKKPPFVTDWGDHWGSDCFLSDSSVGLPTMIPYFDTLQFWHNSIQRYEHIDYEKFSRVNAVYTALIAAIASPSQEVSNRFLPTAAAYAVRRLAELANMPPTRQGTGKMERLLHRKAIEEANLRSFLDADASPDVVEQACKILEHFVTVLEAISDIENNNNCKTPIFDSTEKIVPRRTSIGIPHDFARAPLEKRWHPVIMDILSRVFSAMDGKKTLKTLLVEAEWEAKVSWSESEIADFIDTLRFMDKYGYIELLEE